MTPDRARTVRLLPFGDVEAEALEAIRTAIAERFGARVETEPPREPSPAWYDPTRRQYRVDLVLDDLVATLRAGREWRLAILDGDLFTPGLDFAFGQATVDGCCGAIGLARLRPDFHGQPHDRRLFLRRAVTEAVHELGHIAGLDHCPDPRCVMHFSNTLQDTDQKGPDFCPRCRP